MNLQSSHFPYELPEDEEQPFQPASLDSEVTFMYHPPEQTPNVWNAYLNSIRFGDQQIGRLVAYLKASGQLDDTIIVLLGENGEAFHENGSVGHAREPVEPAVHVATLFHGPNYFEPGESDYPLEHIDILPTLLGVLGWQSHPNFQGIDILSNERPELTERLLFHHVNTGAARADAVQWAGRWKLLVDRRSGTTALYDLLNDPDESEDISQRFPVITAHLNDSLALWHDRQLAYYRYPAYYQHFYPPKAPLLSKRQLQQMLAELSGEA